MTTMSRITNQCESGLGVAIALHQLYWKQEAIAIQFQMPQQPSRAVFQ
jgi:hypothetical protein